ncbi:MAG: hypothetical protein M3275_15005 [Thermoproteota archaeon]|nr:hypothetical protein [Thermoproteota archaeon]
MRIGFMAAAATNIKTFSRINKKKLQQLDIVGSYCCSICGKKLKKFTRRRTTSENLLSCWQCMILNNADS